MRGVAGTSDVAGAIFQSVESAAFDDGVRAGLAELASSPPRLLLIVPLLLASVAILQDAAGQMNAGWFLIAH